MTDALPATYLQHHANAKAVIDLSSAYDLTRISHPWLVTTCEWDNKLIRRAIVWLCQLTNKPILKLTNKDYSEHGLGELLALYGSAYNVNIKIFNDIQHTITGWPGGKPNADDSNRPERAEPYPKRVILFSPHPDDDVISMGGTLRRLCDQHHDVHVAYQTSGNIAVGDEEVIRYCEYLCDVCDKYSPKDKTIRKKAEEIIQYLRYDKKEDGKPERPDVLFMGKRRPRPTVYSPRPHPSSRTMGRSFLNTSACQRPFSGQPPWACNTAYGYWKTFGNASISANFCNLFFPMRHKDTEKYWKSLGGE